MKEKCVTCKKDIEEQDKEFALDPQAHLGILGPVHEKCYDQAVKEEPELPWKDPISSEVDFQAMAEDLGIEDPEEQDWDQEET